MHKDVRKEMNNVKKRVAESESRKNSTRGDQTVHHILAFNLKDPFRFKLKLKTIIKIYHCLKI